MIRGVVGEVKWQYFTAATVNGYTVDRDDAKVWSLSATVVRLDPFNLSQRPLFFVAPTKRGAFRWPIQTFRIDAFRLRARLGPPVSQPKVPQPKGVVS